MRNKRLKASARRRGQAIVEYATVLAFVAFIIAFAFSLARGTLFAAISDSYVHVNSTLTALNQAALAAGP